MRSLLANFTQYTLHVQKSLMNSLLACKRCHSNSHIRNDVDDDDVEPPDVEPHDTETDRSNKSESQIYQAKKKISSDVFRYIMQANDQKLKQMKLTDKSGVKRQTLQCVSETL